MEYIIELECKGQEKRELFRIQTPNASATAQTIWKSKMRKKTYIMFYK